MKIEQRKRIGSSRLISATKSNSPIGRARSRTPRATSRIQSSYFPTPRAENCFEQIFRSSVWRGGSVSSIDRRIASCSSSSSSIATAPSSEEKVSQSMWIAVRSAYRVTAQKPLLGGASGCQTTGASCRSRSNHSNGIRST